MTEESIFAAALEKTDPAQRAVFLAQACAGDDKLRRQVEVLLQAHEASGGFLNEPVVAAVVTAAFSHAATLRENPGTRIGPYKLLQQIGEGGMGVVYMAEQQEPVRRKVALKIIKPGMDSAQVIARFEAERQALAMMDHQNIARVLDAGTTESGRPYFVMELVHGVPITTFCDDNQLTPRERLELFIPVCHAIQHAHQKGIIHRDIKPSNVLVTMYDDKPVPKVIDFGVAKAVEQRLTERTLFTQYGALVGTFEYMSPEQAEMNAYGVDTRSDIYSLGVLLYELLTGTTPLDRKLLREAALHEMVRLIKHEEPPRPSVRLSSSDTLVKIAAAGKTQPARLSKLVRGELDWIVMKALEKDRSRRYDTASDLARDVERYVKDEPVQACPPSAGYLLRKFVRKHQKALATTAAFALLLLIGAGVSVWLAVRATNAEATAIAERDDREQARQAEAGQRVIADLSKQKAQQERDEAQQARAGLRRHLYASQLTLAQTAWRDTEISRFPEILDALRPLPGEEDLRGFEWYYLWRLGHSDLLTVPGNTHQWGQLAFSPDGKRLATGGGDGDNPNNVVKLWEVATGKGLLVYKGQPDPNTGLAFSPDGKRIASASGVRDERSVRVWDAATGKEAFALKGQFGRFTSVVFSPDGSRIATGSSGTVKVWNAADGTELLTFPGDTQGVTVVSFTSDGQRIASYSGDNGIVKVWDAATGKEVLSLDLPSIDPQRSYSISTAAFHPSGNILAVAYYGESDLVLWDLTTRKAIHTLRGHTSPPRCLAFSTDGQRLASAGSKPPGGGDTSVKIWDVQSGEQLFSFKGHTGAITSVVFSHDGSRIATGSWDRTVKVWDATTGQEARTLPYRPLSLAFSPDGRFLALGHPAEKSPSSKLLTVINVMTGQPLFTREGFNELGGLVFSPDSRFLAGLDRVINPENSSESKVSVWQATTGEQVCTFQYVNVSFWSLVFSSDSKRLSGLPVDGTPVKVWDVNLGRELPSLGEPPLGKLAGPVVDSRGAFSPDGQMVAVTTWTEDGTRRLTVWEAATSRKIFSFEEKGKPPIFGIVFSADGKRLATATIKAPWDRVAVITVWETATGKEIFSLRGHSGIVLDMTFSPDGKRLATSCSNVIKLWDMASGQELLTLTTPSAINCLAFRPNGNTLVSGGQIQKLISWDATPLPAEGNR